MSPDLFIYSVLIFLVIIVFYITKSIIIKLNLKVNNVLLSASITLLSIPILLKISFFIWLISINVYLPTNFDKERWNDDPEHRYKMAKSLVYGKILKYKSKIEIQYILGTPESIPLDSIWIYYLGTRPGIIVDPDFLKIYFTDSLSTKIIQECEGKGDCEINDFN